MAPKDENELRNMLYTALHHQGPSAIRYPRGQAPGVALDRDFALIPWGEAEILRNGGDITIVAFGSMVHPAVQAAEELEKEEISAGVVNCRFAKPLDRKIAEMARKTGRVLVVEENIKQGGLGGAVLEMFNDLGLNNIRVGRMGLPDKFIEHGSSSILRTRYGLDVSGIAKEARDLFKQER
jgi:1-deoxy-D-xylulose-5-phosphate synthase